MLVTPTPQVFQTLAERYDSARLRAVRRIPPCPLDCQRRRVVGCVARRRRRARAPSRGGCGCDAHRRRADLGRDRPGRQRRHARLSLGPARDPSQPPPRCRLPGRDERTRGSGAITLPHDRDPQSAALDAGGGKRPSGRGGARARRDEGIVPADCRGAGGRLSRHRPGPTGIRRFRQAAGGAYDARYFAAVVVDLLDALDIECAHLIGNSLGGRVALEVGMRHPDRVGRSVLLAPSLAWKRHRTLAPLLRVVRPELGLIQFTPRSIVETIVAAADPRGRRRLGRGGRRRVPARLPHPCRPVRLLRGRTSHLSRDAQRQQRLLAKAGGAPGRCTVHLGTPRPARADRLRAPRRRGTAGRPPSRARLRTRPADRAAAGDARGDPRVPPVVRSNRSTRRSAAAEAAAIRWSEHEGWRALYAVPAGVSAVRREPHRAQKCPTCAAAREVMIGSGAIDSDVPSPLSAATVARTHSASAAAS